MTLKLFPLKDSSDEISTYVSKKKIVLFSFVVFAVEREHYFEKNE